MSDRDAAGRFLPGHQAISGGRPKHEIETQTWNAFSRAYQGEHLDRMVEQLVKRTDRGDLHAIRLVLSYLLGMPAQRVESSGDDALATLLQSWRDQVVESRRGEATDDGYTLTSAVPSSS